MTSQRNILNRERETAVALESTYCSYSGGVPTAPSGTWPNVLCLDVFLYDDVGVIDGISEAREDVVTESVWRVDPKVPYHGLRIATTLTGISKYCQAVKGNGSAQSAQMDSYWVRPTAAGQPGAMATCLILGAALGGGTYFSDQSLSTKTFDQAGSVAVSGGSSTSVHVTTSTGTQFNAGTWIAVQTGSGSTYGYDFTKVLSVSGDVLTVYPALSGTPAVGAVVKNLYNYFPAETHGTAPGVASGNASLFIARRWVESASTVLSQILAGVYGDVSFEFTQGDKSVMYKFGGKASDFVGPSETSMTVAAVTDTMGSITRFAPQIYVQSSTAAGSGSSSFPATITRGTTMVCPKFTIEVKGNYEMVRDLNAPQTVAGVLDSSGRPRFGKCVFTVRMDAQAYADFQQSPDVLYNILVAQPIGTGITQSFWLWEVSCATLVSEPKATKMGEYLYVDMEFNPLPDGTQALQGAYSTVTMPTTPGSPTVGQADACRAAFRVAFG